MFEKSNRGPYQTMIAMLIMLVAASVAIADDVTSAFTYQGQLKTSGLPINGTYDMRFRLYDAATAGNQIGTMQIHDGVTNPSINVVDGLFTVKLDFGAVFDSTALWLEIEVRPDGPTGYTTLQPRQALCAAPYAAYALNAGGPWQLTGADLFYNQGDVGIGVDAPLAPLHVAGEIHSRGGASNGIHVYNPTNGPDGTVSVALDWLDDIARIRYGGSGAGSQNGFAIQGQGDSTKLRLLNNGDMGLGDDNPQARLHLRTLDLDLQSAALENDELIVEADDAVMGLYSSASGNWASAIALKEISGGNIVDTWGIVRRTSTATSPSSLRFTYGASDNYSTNPSFLTIENDGDVGIGTAAPVARLDVATSLPNNVIANFAKGLSNTNGVYVEMEGSVSDCGAVRAVNNGFGAAVWARSQFTGFAPAFVAQRPVGSNFNSSIAEFKLGNTDVVRIDVEGDIEMIGGGNLEMLNGELRLNASSRIRFSDGSVQTSAANILSSSVAVNPPLLNAGANTVITVNIAGAEIGDAVIVNPGTNFSAAYAISFARVSAVDTVSIGLINPGSVAVDPTSSTWQFRIIK